MECPRLAFEMVPEKMARVRTKDVGFRFFPAIKGRGYKFYSIFRIELIELSK